MATQPTLVNPILLNGQWQASEGKETFTAWNPTTGDELPDVYPISTSAELNGVAKAAKAAYDIVRNWTGDRFAAFLDDYAARIDSDGDALAQMAATETGLAYEPRLRAVEIPRTVNQMKAAADAARSASWASPTIDTATGIRSVYGSIGPVVVFGPNNFPLAINCVAGNDFAAAVAAGNPVIAKGHPLHPTTTRMLAEHAQAAAEATGMPAGFVQLVYHMENTDGLALVSHDAVAAATFTGSRAGGLALKAVADERGKPFYAEMSSINPVFVLPGVLAERGDELAGEFVGSCLLGTGQFCTNPGLVVLQKGDAAEAFVKDIGEKMAAAPNGTLLGTGVGEHYEKSLGVLTTGGATIVAQSEPDTTARFTCQNTLLRVDGDHFLSHAAVLQTEAFGPSSLVVVCDDESQMVAVANSFEGNLTGCIYSAADGSDDAAYDAIAPTLRTRVGRLLNDKMPTGVAVSSAMNHGGPFPASGHPGWSSVGLPQSIGRFGALQCYDNVREGRLPAVLQDRNPGSVWRKIDGEWTQANCEKGAST